MFRTYLTAPWKSEYENRKKDPNQCFLNAITQRTTDVEAWEVFRDDQIMVLRNRFPYNPGHLLISPLKHHDQFEALAARLASHLTLKLQRGIKLQKHNQQPAAFNIGLNLGSVAGGSINHLHWHIVPRYPGDLNFMEILGTRVLVETLEQTLNKLQQSSSILLSGK